MVSVCCKKSEVLVYTICNTVCVCVCVGDCVQLGLDVWKRLMAEPLKDTLVTLLLAELHKYVVVTAHY